MPHKICKKCSHPNGVRSKICKECSNSFEAKVGGAASIMSTTKTAAAAKLSLDNPKFYGTLLTGISAEFTYGEADDDLVGVVARMRGLDENDVEKACQMTIRQLWRKMWSL